MLGVLSLMDAMLEVPTVSVREKRIPVDQETKSGLPGSTSRLRPLYQLMLASESRGGKLSPRLHLCLT